MTTPRRIALRLEDLRIEEVDDGAHTTVTITHLPTGLVASYGEYSGRIRNKVHALYMLQESLERHQESQ